jgi:hypothetical protein
MLHVSYASIVVRNFFMQAVPWVPTFTGAVVCTYILHFHSGLVKEVLENTSEHTSLSMQET